jgi:hypothetical protein
VQQVIAAQAQHVRFYRASSRTRGKGFPTRAPQARANASSWHLEILRSKTNFGKYQDQRKAMKMATSKKRPTSENQSSLSVSSKMSSQHGGHRPGAGRKHGSGNKPTFEREPCAAALAKALDGKTANAGVAVARADGRRCRCGVGRCGGRDAGRRYATRERRCCAPVAARARSSAPQFS